MKRTLLASLLAFGFPLTTMTVRADEPAPAADVAPAAAAPAPIVHARLVGVILSSAQALLWDEDRAEYALHKVGEELLGGRIVELEADHLVVDRGDTREVVEIAAPPETRVAGKRPRRMPAMIISAAPDVPTAAAAAQAAPDVPTAVAAAQAAVDRVVAAQAAANAAPAMVAAAAPATAAAPALVAPTAPAPATAAPVAALTAVATPAASARAAIAAPAAVAAAPAVSAPAAVATAPAVSAPAAVAPAAPAGPLVLARAELDRELGDFGSLSQQLQVAAQPEGGFRLSQVRGGSFFERIGLRTNDVLVRVDGRPINGVDDASAAYAWLRVANQFTVEVLRDGRPLTLRYVVSAG